jgi:MFS superfamily sulfate permease-like transporter
MSAIVFIDLLTGVLVGVMLSIAKLLYHFSHMKIRKESEDKRHKTNLYLSGAATFLSLPKLAQAIEDVPADSELHVHLEDVDYIDHACLDLLMTWDKQHRASGGSLVIDWGTIGAMYRDRRRTPRGELVPREATSPSELLEILQDDDDDDATESAAAATSNGNSEGARFGVGRRATDKGGDVEASADASPEAGPSDEAEKKAGTNSLIL